MIFNKYNYVDDNITIGSYSSSSSSNNSSDTSTRGDTPSRGSSASRVIWGQYDDGGDIEESMKINGNIYIAKTSDGGDEYGETGDKEDWSDTADTEEDFNFDWDDDTEGGSLYVENNVKAKGVEANEVFAKNHLYINYPHPNGTKQCVNDLIKNNADNISSNTTKINNLTTTVNNHTTQINNLNTSVSNNTTNISNNTTEINNLKDRLDAGVGITEDRVNEILNNWKYGNYGRPVILLTGKLRKSSVTGSTTWFFEGIRLDSITNISMSYTGGLMTVSFDAADNFYNWIYTVHATQMKSGDTGDGLDNTSITGRSDGAHWFETRFDNTNRKVYIREFHQGDGNNDTWKSDYWGGDGGGIKEVAITVIGYAYQTATTAEEAALIEAQANIINSDNTETQTESNEIN